MDSDTSSFDEEDGFKQEYKSKYSYLNTDSIISRKRKCGQQKNQKEKVESSTKISPNGKRPDNRAEIESMYEKNQKAKIIKLCIKDPVNMIWDIIKITPEEIQRTESIESPPGRSASPAGNSLQGDILKITPQEMWSKILPPPTLLKVKHSSLQILEAPKHLEFH